MRKFLVFVAGAGLLFLLYLTVTASVVVLTFTPAHVKKWLHDGNVYSTVIDSLTKQGQTAVAQTTDGSTTDNSEQIKTAIKQSVTPQFLQTTTEQFIDGVTPWLNGQTPKPTFSIDVSGVKQSIVQNLADQARTRYASLPPCTPGQVPDASDIFNVPCQVAGVSIEPQIQQAIQDFNSSQDFLPNTVITADNLNSNNGGVQKPVFDTLHDVPAYYRWTRIAPFVFGALAIIAMLIIIFASTEKRAGVRRVMTALGIAGLTLLAVIWLSTWGVHKAQAHIAKVASDDSVVQNTAIQVIKAMQHDANTSLLIFAIVFLVLAGGLLAYWIVARPKTPKTPAAPDADEPKPQQPKPTKPKSTMKPPRLIQMAA